jgi:hypothetical protein
MLALPDSALAYFAIAATRTIHHTVGAGSGMAQLRGGW